MGTARGWAPGEVLELAVDDHGLTSGGRRPELFVEIDGDRAVNRRPRGTGATPAMKALVKEVNKTLATERSRVEGLLAQDRVWAWETWRERYLDHPVTGSIGRRLIWQVSADRATWVTGLPEPAPDGWTLAGVTGPEHLVRLWHPVEADAAEVAAWRDRVAASGLRQPFKQAFREVYRLTPAEQQTRVYSNRFAGHILRYRQANALMRVRGWSAAYLGVWDGGYDSDATKEFASGSWQVTFGHEVAGREPHQIDIDFCSTDQVRFARRDGRRWELSPLADVPARVFSEAMRDVDLFIGVTSIAADETWADRGEHRFRDYWESASVGDLSGGAEVRRDVLARLLPRLKIGAQCELTDRFLQVRGSRAVYKIHLGSANILMEPNDAYLCIVPARGTPRVALPFDDDDRLSLILSKAFLLAADDTITDPTILHQLPR
ncbi:hypothetical protein Q0Z83_057580 [Actinoplanes sichuanensis]|nr:hypothetical protein Q0Z83_057580 [Actinoplanes sichuanensis]